MSENTLDYLRASERRARKGSPWLGLGLAIALGLNAYQLLRTDHQSRDMVGMEQRLQYQITRLSDATSAAFDVDEQRWHEVRTALETAAIKTPHPTQPDTAPSQPDAAPAQPEVEGSHSLRARIIERREQAAADVKPEDTGTSVRSMGPQARDTSASLDSVNAKPHVAIAKLDATNALTSAKVEHVSNPFESTASDSKRTDMAAMNSAIPTKSAVPTAGKKQNERNSFDLDLVQDKTGQMFGDVRIALKKSDPKHNRFTLEIFADDKVVEKKDQAVNEPMQVYVSVSSQPYEIVIKQVKRDEVIGSLAVPKAKTAAKASAKADSL